MDFCQTLPVQWADDIAQDTFFISMTSSGEQSLSFYIDFLLG